jgi:NAD(P)H-dependent FMN reductase
LISCAPIRHWERRHGHLEHSASPRARGGGLPLSPRFGLLMPGRPRRQPVRFLVFSASLRRDSLNTRLAELAAAAIEAGGGDVDVAAMRDFDAPSYDQDVQRDEGFPPGAEEFRRRLEACHGFVVASPEYNASMPGVLKNAIDWVSRYQPQPFNERHGLLMSASPSMGGGNRGLWALRIPFEHLGSRLYPDMFSLPGPTWLSPLKGASPTSSSSSGSTRTSATSWIWSRLPRITHA